MSFMDVKQQKKMIRALRLSSMICLSLTLTITTALMPISGAYAAIDNLPSESFDDYDEQKYAQQLSDATQRFEQERQNVASVENSLQQAINTERQVRAALENSNSQMVQYQRDEQSLIRELEENRRDMAVVSRNIHGLEADLRESRRDLEQAQDQLNQVKTREQKIAQEHSVSEAQLKNFNQAVDGAQGVFQQKKQAAEAGAKAIDELQKKINQLQGSIVETLNAKTALENQLRTLQTEKQGLENDISVKRNYKKTLEAQQASKQNELQQLRTQLEVAKTAGDQAKVAALQTKINTAEGEMNALKKEIASVDQSLLAPTNRLAQVSKSVEETDKQIEQKQKSIESQNGQLQAAKDELPKKQALQPGLAAEQENARKAVETSVATRNNHKNNHEALEKRLTETRERFRDAQARVKNLQDRQQDLRRALNQNENQQRRLAGEGESLGRRLTDTRNRIANLERSINQLNTQLDQAETYRRQVENDRALAIGRMQAADAERVRRSGRLQEVQENLADAHRKMSEIAGAEGGQDGAREGAEFGDAEGKKKGEKDGLDRGDADGTAAGKTRDYNQGYGVGRARGEKNGESDARANSETNGKKDGTEKGREDGLVVAYNDGKTQGLEEGVKNGSDKTAYAKGKKAGEEFGLNEAREEAKAQDPIGFADKEKEFRSAPLHDVVVGEDILSRGFRGLQGKAGAEHGDGRYYNPRPKRYPHPTITRYYMESYDANYRGNLESSYSSAYAAAYKASYDTYYDKAKTAALKKDYPESRTKGDKDAYERFYREVYDAKYPDLYKDRYSFYYGKAHLIAKQDADTIRRGFNDGNAIASEQKGYKDGRASSYATNLPKEKAAAYQRGSDRATSKYTNAPQIEIVDAKLIEANGDGVYRPGENAAVELTIKNFGLQAKTGLRSIVSVQGIGVSAPSQEISVADIPPQSHARVRGVALASISESARENTGFSISLQFRDGQGVLLQRTFSQTIQYPTSVQAMGFDGVLIPGTPNVLKLQLTNRSAKTQNLAVSIKVDDTKVSVDTTQASANGLAPNQSATVEFRLTGKPEANFESAPIEVRVTESGQRFAKDLTVNATVIRKHSVNPDSIGLILSGDLSKGAGKLMFSTGKYDTWDLRVDGPITGAESLKPYVSKTIQLLTNESMTVDARTAASLSAHLSAGGTLVVWGPAIASSQLVERMGATLGIAEVRTGAINTAVTGSGFFKEARLSYAGEAADIRLSGALPILNTGRGVVGALSSVAGLSQPVGRAVTLTLDPSTLGAENIKALLALLDQVRTPFIDKMQAVVKNKAKLYLTIEEIKEEMRLDDARADIAFIEKSMKDSKLNLALQYFLALSEEDVRDEFIKAYPELFTTTMELKDKDLRDTLVYMYEWIRVGPWYSKRTMKGVYCTYFSKRDDDPRMCSK